MRYVGARRLSATKPEAFLAVCQELPMKIEILADADAVARKAAEITS
ncbi:MAG TPA: hypothetical protein VGR30_20110 [Candidatus Binatia bacterium]|nr:hypothetical protein [Candidatus Binatia bacterium]